MVVLEGNLLLDLVHVMSGHFSIIAVDDLGELFQSRTASLDVLEVDKDEFKTDPTLQREKVPLVWGLFFVDMQ